MLITTSTSSGCLFKSPKCDGSAQHIAERHLYWFTCGILLAVHCIGYTCPEAAHACSSTYASKNKANFLLGRGFALSTLITDCSSYTCSKAAHAGGSTNTCENSRNFLLGRSFGRTYNCIKFTNLSCYIMTKFYAKRSLLYNGKILCQGCLAVPPREAFMLKCFA